jgi:monoamine oxidase
VSLGYLKQNLIKFTPELSDGKKEAIEKLGFGVLNKIYVEFEEKFWKTDGSYIYIIDDPINPFGIIWDISDLIEKNSLMFLVNSSQFEFNLGNEEKLKQIIEKMFSSLFPEKSIKIKNILRTNWAKDPYTFGTFSSYHIGSTPSMRAEFQKNEGLLYFAGEHTHMHNYATTHGAFHSGIDTANRIILENRRSLK